ncbi:TadE/TadG family type IV pilus assembly protein [Kordiimonas pumila]|uniref:TadE/TadG family type IV pilus assembly protein n=1 Tax=Kordiimonas pumila TaxID=2161677 RepID=A0ABV7D6B2_9PROT|nr:TadE/TadG family type IV pilus assembly protein [Kordiimonas pumila]
MNPIKKIMPRLRHNKEGSVLVEIALSIPIFLGLLTGMVEVGSYLLLHMKMQHTVVAIADLVTRDETINEATMTDIFQAVPQVMAPYNKSADTLMMVSSISQLEDEQPTIFWQRSGGGTLSAASGYGEEGDTATLPADITMRDDETVLVTEIFYRYEPLVFRFLPNQTLKRTAFFRPRIGALQQIDED